MQKKPSTDNQNPSMEYIAGPIEVRCRADGVFGQDRGGRGQRQYHGTERDTDAERHNTPQWWVIAADMRHSRAPARTARVHGRNQAS